MVTKTVNPKMIELARQSRGLRQRELASIIESPNQSNLSKIERGELPVSDESLNNIAKALDYPLDFFYLEEVKSPLSNIYFRKRATLPQKDLDRIFSEIRIILKSIDLLLEDIEVKEYPKYTLDITQGWTPQDAAIRMREIMQIPSGSVKDIVRHVEELGIIVFFYDCHCEKFDGLTAYSDNGVPVIFANKNTSNDRIKFTIVHELGHLVMHIPCDVEPWRDVELEANTFCSEFFMPKKDCYSDLQELSFNRLGELKSYWGISKAAIVRRAKDLGLITKETYLYLMIELGRKGERKTESGFVDIDKPKILKTAINLLKEELGYTEEFISNKICLNIEDFSRKFEISDVPVRLKIIKRAS